MQWGPAPAAENVGDLVVRDAEEPRPEGRSLVAEAADRPESGQEGALGRVLGVMVVAEEVEGIAVDPIEVAPVQDAERRPIDLGRADIREVRVAERPQRPRGRIVRHAGTVGLARTTSPLAIATGPSSVRRTSAPVASTSTAVPRRGRPPTSTSTVVPSVRQAAR